MFINKLFPYKFKNKNNPPFEDRVKLFLPKYFFAFYVVCEQEIPVAHFLGKGTNIQKIRLFYATEI